MHSVKHILQYICCTICYAIVYLPLNTEAKGSHWLTGYSDASYANAKAFRSTSSNVFVLAGGPITWFSRKQPITAVSSTEAKYVSAAEAVKQAIWIQHILYSVGKDKVYGEATNICMDPEKLVYLGIDNRGALALAANSIGHGRSKHISIRYHLIHEYIECGEVQVTYVPTEKMLADSLMKIMKAPILNHMVKTFRLDHGGQ